MGNQNFDFSAFLNSSSGGQPDRTAPRRNGNGNANATAASGGPINQNDLVSLLSSSDMNQVGMSLSSNDLFYMPWESLAPLDPIVAAPVPPTSIDDPLASDFTTNDLLAKSKSQSFHCQPAQGTITGEAHSLDTLLDPTQAPSSILNDASCVEASGSRAMGVHPQIQEQINDATAYEGGDSNVANTRLAYRARILAHHSHFLSNDGDGAVAPTGLPIKPTRDMPSMSAVPVSSGVPSRVMQVTQQAQKLSLQERRRMARIEQSKAGNKAKESDNVQVSGRNQKRSTAGAEETRPQQTKQLPFLRTQHQPHSLPASQPEIVAPVQVQASTLLRQQDHGMKPPSAAPPGTIPLESIYSASGFDMLKALMRVASRPNPCVKIGPVDLSCSFTVADATLPDQPLIYCSDTFCRLTGYARSELYGRNCRLLQSPDGIVQQGSERTSTDNQAVAHIRKYVGNKKECQASLINYRKDGQPFINLVTIVPITWDDTDTIKYLVGFQVDLVEQPGAILEKMPDGSYFVNYSSVATGVPTTIRIAGGQPIAKDTSAITTVESLTSAQEDAQRRLSNAQSIAEAIDGGHNDTKHWARLLLDNSHDLIYVLSLKGTFLYVSPSSDRILGFKPSELIGKSISDFIHPSDVVPVFRELKDSTSNANISAAARASRASYNASPRNRNQPMRDTGPAVNLLFRMRTKSSSYQWIESVGKLHLEQGKGRKVVVSSGRPRPFYHLANSVMTAVAASNEPGFWFKVSLDGLFLNVSAPVVNMLGITAHQMAGKTFKELCEQESLSALYQSLRTPSTTLILHSLLDSMANRIPVLSTFYPSSIRTERNHESVWVQTRPAPPNLSLQPNIVYSSPPKEGDPNDASDTSVFAELSPYRSSSWCYELHQLRNINKRLKQQVRAAHQRRASKPQQQTGGAGSSTTTRTPHSPRLSDAAMKDMMYPHPFKVASGSNEPTRSPIKLPWNHEGLLPPSATRASSSSAGRNTPVDSLLDGFGTSSVTRSTSFTTPSQTSGGRSGSGSAGENSGTGSGNGSGSGSGSGSGNGSRRSSGNRTPAEGEADGEGTSSGIGSGQAPKPPRKPKSSRRTRRKSSKSATKK